MVVVLWGSIVKNKLKLYITIKNLKLWELLESFLLSAEHY